ncbi:MAG: tetratricopeptide repeat protein, partial [Thermoanaerobaculia bacterium]
RLYPEGHVSIATDLNNLAGLLLERNEPAAAEPLYREAAELFDRTQGAGFWRSGIARLGLGRSLAALGRWAAAEKELLAAEHILSSAQGVPAGRHLQSVEALVALYETWDKAAPSGGRGSEAAKWRARLDGLKADATAKP